MIDRSCWKGRNVLVTGHTGFKGGWLTLWLEKLGARVSGVALHPSGKPTLFHAADVGREIRSSYCDVRDLPALTARLAEVKPEIVIHLAAQSLVRESYADPVGTYATNVMGTVNILEASRRTPSVRVLVNVTSDKCYDERPSPGYRESDPMGGNDPYSSSKGCSELVTAAYRRSFLSGPGSLALASARAGNVIGGGDWATDRLVPDFFRAVETRTELVVRKPQAVRPWQFVLEPLYGYLMLAQALWVRPAEFAEGWNFGPDPSDEWTVGRLVQRLGERWGSEARWKIDGSPHLREADYLTLDSTKARSRLGWTPLMNVESALQDVVDWFRGYFSGADARAVTLAQIERYEAMITGSRTMT